MFTAILFLTAISSPGTDALAAGFQTPPASARPHTWWHWMDGNVTKEGITADLKAMKQAGIGGAQLFTVSLDLPPGPAKYGSKLWRELTAFAVKEAARFGIELCIHNCDGWSSSGGPWIRPQDAMQVVAWSTVNVQGPTTFSEALPPVVAPAVSAKVDYARDIAVYAYPTPAGKDSVDTTTGGFRQKTGVERGDGIKPDLKPSAGETAIPADGLVMLTEKLDANGRLTWDVPEGNWTILRIGHVPTGKTNHPSTREGEGLEVDKLSKTALDRHWNGLMAKVVADIGPKGTKTLNNVLIDSYEVFGQNWTPNFRAEFRKRRGYDPLPYLPVIAGRLIESKERSERFLWDLRRTIADLYADNYYGHMAEIAHRNGMRFSTEPYGNGGMDNLQSGSRSDIPMGEFWLGGMAMETTKLAASVGHTNGRPVIGAEAFTAGIEQGRWIEEPYTMKTVGDLAFANGINRYIFHRYAMQPWIGLRPGMSMGQYGSHLDRTQTWWTEAATWMKYVARCQYLLQAGRFQADICYFTGESAPTDLPGRSSLRPEIPDGYDYDGCDREALLKMKVRDGKVVLPSGMSYRLLVLPESTFMTPAVALKVRDLIAGGATVLGPKPERSPSLTNYPACDDYVRAVADGVWGRVRGNQVVNRKYGKGRIFANLPVAKVLQSTLKLSPDFSYTPASLGNRVVNLHRQIDGADVYFVANQRNRAAQLDCTFRVTGSVPELWHPETGEIEEVAAYRESGKGTTVPLRFDAAESVFVVFRRPSVKGHLQGVSAEKSGRDRIRIPKIEIQSARYEAPDGHGADVTPQVRKMVRSGEMEIPATNAMFGDPIPMVEKRLVVSYLRDGKRMSQTVPENGSIELVALGGSDLTPNSYTLKRLLSGALELTPWANENFKIVRASGRSRIVKPVSPSVTLPIAGPWRVRFAPNLGAPESALFPKLVSWPNHPNPGIKYFSGSALYRKEFVVPASLLSENQRVRLNLGDVKNFATVTLNGREVAVLWKPPFTLDVTGLVKPGLNRLQIKVTNLWPNRIIGDEQLPPDVEWNGSQIKRWPDWLVNGKPRPKTGRITFETWRYYDKNSPLIPSGLIGPVTLQSAKRIIVRD